MRHDLLHRVGNILLTIGFTTLLLVTIAGLIILLLLVGQGEAQTTRVDTFDPSSQRTGAAVITERSGRLDLYDTQSRRTGYGTLDKSSGRLDLYDTKSRRTGYGTLNGNSRRGK